MLDPPVSPQAVRNWVHEDPSIVAWRDPVTGYPYFDPDALQAWRQINRPHGLGRGGARPGAGNRHQKWRKTDVVHASGSIFARGGEEEGEGPRAGGGEGRGPSDYTAEELRRALADPTSVPLGFHAGRAVHELLKAAKVAEEVKAKRGEVLGVEEARAAWGRALTVLARALDDVAERVAPELVRVAMEEREREGIEEAEPVTPAEAAQKLSRRFAAAVREAVEAARMRVADDPLGLAEKSEVGVGGMAA